MNQQEPIYYDPKLPISKIVMGSQVCNTKLSNQDLDFLLQLYSYVLCFLYNATGEQKFHS